MEILEYPNPVLLKPSRPLTDDEIREGKADGIDLHELVAGMGEMLRSKGGLGLAAPQVGVNLRLLIATGENKKTITLVNPVILDRQGKCETKEGCLSVPGVYINVKRSKTIKVSTKILGATEDGKIDSMDLEMDEMLSRVAQHEIDHLDGLLITTRGNLIGNLKARDQIEKLERQYALWEKRKSSH